jgi:hypothetical protein
MLGIEWLEWLSGLFRFSDIVPLALRLYLLAKTKAPEKQQQSRNDKHDMLRKLLYLLLIIVLHLPKPEASVNAATRRVPAPVQTTLPEQLICSKCRNEVVNPTQNIRTGYVYCFECIRNSDEDFHFFRPLKF